MKEIMFSSTSYNLFKKMAFRFDPEFIHEKFVSISSSFPYSEKTYDKKYSLKVAGIDFPFPLGMAAGFDKNSEMTNFLEWAGFGFVEVGTITPKGQLGNPKPRLFRYPEEESLRNHLGFNNKGAEYIRNRIKEKNIPIGINIGKNKDTPLEKSFEDYEFLMKYFRDKGSYFTVNISSPNTKNLRKLQEETYLRELLSCIKENSDKPIFIKLSPDLTDHELEVCIKTILDFKMNVVATNTSNSLIDKEGGVSGKLLHSKAKEIREKILAITKGCHDFELIGVGGISNPIDLWDFWKMGGKVVQVYSAFIFQGPKLIKDFKDFIDHKLKISGALSLKEYLSSF